MNHYKDSQNNIYGFDANATVPSGLTPVSFEEVKAINELNAKQAFENLSYAIKRSREYPPITDYIDGVVKGDQAQIDKYISDCLAVKARYPKV